MFLQYVNHLDRTRYRPTLCLLQRRGALLDDLAGDVDVVTLDVERMRGAGPVLVRTLHRARPAAVVSTLAHCNALLLGVRPLLPRGMRLLVREANLPAVSLSRPLRQLVRWLYPTADAVLCPSRAIAHELQTRFDVPQRVLVPLPNPVDTATLHALAAAPLEASHEDLAEAPVGDVVAVGRLDPQKGYDILLDALARTSFSCDILGGGLETPHGQELVAQRDRLGLQGRVRFRGHQANPWEWMARAECVVAASRYEGQSNALLEAQALGVPVVATRIPGMEEVVAHDDTGVLVATEDPTALAAGLQQVMQRSWDHDVIQARAASSHGLAEAVGHLEGILDAQLADVAAPA